MRKNIECIFLLNILSFMIFFINCFSTKSNQSNHTNKSTKASEQDVTYSSQLVEGEYVVMFYNYYSQMTRMKLIDEAFQLLGRSKSHLKVMPHHPLLEGGNSDFDVVVINQSLPFQIKGGLSRYNIRSLTLQKRIIRCLKVNHSRKPSSSINLKKLLRSIQKGTSISQLLSAPRLWAAGYQGQGVKVAVFDTGLSASHPHFSNVIERTDWTGEKIADDGLGHGTFVAGVIGGSSPDCPGLAPKSDLYICRVFTNKQVSYTSWFLDAFNYAIQRKIDVLNLSIGGPDFMDEPFVAKVWQLSANNVILVSAIGNDGPLYGTLNNPADQMDVIGVGGIDGSDVIAHFSSRGMTTWELPGGYGRVKPDLVTHVTDVMGSAIEGGCRVLSGTSVGAPIVSGVIALLLSSVATSRRRDVINPAMIKQSLMESSTRLPVANMFEQGQGKVDLIKAYSVINSYQPQASLVPSYLDFTETIYMWPYSSQPLYHRAIPIIANITIINGAGVTGTIVDQPTWHPHTHQNGDMLQISFTYSRLLWPWSGYLAVHISAAPRAEAWRGVAEGHVQLIIQSPADNLTNVTKTTLTLPLKIPIIPTPPREQRILWDQFHNLRYPPGYFPRDNLDITQDLLDWNGDHIHTNFQGLYRHLRQIGYFIEVLGQPYTCFDASDYGTLLIVDSEEEFFPLEGSKLRRDMEENNLSVIADWYNTTVMSKVRFYDENTRRWWTPQTGGSNVPALNDLLTQFGVQFSDRVLSGHFQLASKSLYYASGASIARFPKKSLVVRVTLKDQAHYMMAKQKVEVSQTPVLGLYQLPTSGGGRLVVYGDSNCFDDAHNKSPSYWLMGLLLKYTMKKELVKELAEDPRAINNLHLPHTSDQLLWSTSPGRMPDNLLDKYSKVLRRQLGDELTIREVPVCQTHRWSTAHPVNKTVTRQRLLSIDDTEVVHLPDMPLVDHQHHHVFRVAAIISVLVAFALFIVKRALKTRRRSFTPRIAIRCCYMLINTCAWSTPTTSVVVR